MDFAASETERLIRKTARSIAENYDDDYWIANQRSEGFPEAFWRDIAEVGFLGINIPEQYAGEGLGMSEMAMVIEEFSANGVMDAGMLFVLTPIFGAVSIVAHGDESQKAAMLPKIASGDLTFCMALTEPNAGTNTLNVDTFAENTGDGFLVNGQKHWISGVGCADRMLLFARTTPAEQVETNSAGFTLFIVDPSDSAIATRRLDTGVPEPVDQYEVTFEDLYVPQDAVLGEADQGLKQIFDTLNTERIAGAASSIGVGRCAVRRASNYASNRSVFDQPIGAHQGIQHPIAEAYSKLEATALITRKAAWLYDRGESCGKEANIAKLRASKAEQEACDVAVQTYGGNGFATSNGVIQMWKSSRLSRVAPISNQMVRNYISERVLGMPRSY